MNDWREELKKILETRPSRASLKDQEQLEETRRRIEAFVEDVVMPAFEDLRAELEKLGREASIDRRRFQASLHVFNEGREEFSYAIRGNAYHKMSFAFPHFGTSGESRMSRAEIVLGKGKRREFDVLAFTREGIIKDFLKEYANWME